MSIDDPEDLTARADALADWVARYRKDPANGDKTFRQFWSELRAQDPELDAYFRQVGADKSPDDWDAYHVLHTTIDGHAFSVPARDMDRLVRDGPGIDPYDSSLH
ncbi:hypothetical protein [Luteimonas kalidii]|uniref:Uncharacterized protein n=1 Tax=Luteimonas kalidii TaxID=3042025 RepID=A0ABT6JUS9_9GAMM|nr:hypothetical protein [Luteimonas kalidii]MDH5834237.1 hypothetical protein [Luteimonas kalidii]